MTLSIERDDRRMGLASDRTVYSSKRNRPLLLYGRLLDYSRPSHGQLGSYRLSVSCLPTIHSLRRTSAIRASSLKLSRVHEPIRRDAAALHILGQSEESYQVQLFRLAL